MSSLRRDSDEIVKLPRGTRVRVPGDTPIVYDTSPHAVDGSITLRSQVVTVAWMTHNPNVIHWAGRGGYWRGVRLTPEMEILK